MITTSSVRADLQNISDIFTVHHCLKMKTHFFALNGLKWVSMNTAQQKVFKKVYKKIMDPDIFCHSDFTWNQFWCFLQFKICHFCVLEALNFDFYNFLHFSKCGIDQINKIQCPKNSKKMQFRICTIFRIVFT